MQPYLIKTISLQECLPLRRNVLWPAFELTDCIEPDDEHATHYGYIINNQMVSCFSVFILTPQRYQIRKFATHPDFQNRGIGKTLFTHVLKELKNNKVETVYLNARSTAIPFYEKFNFQPCGDMYIKHDVQFLPMQVVLDKITFPTF